MGSKKHLPHTKTMYIYLYIYKYTCMDIHTGAFVLFIGNMAEWSAHQPVVMLLPTDLRFFFTYISQTLTALSFITFTIFFFFFFFFRDEWRTRKSRLFVSKYISHVNITNGWDQQERTRRSVWWFYQAPMNLFETFI